MRRRQTMGRRWWLSAGLLSGLVASCGGEGGSVDGDDVTSPLPDAACNADGGGVTVAEPELLVELADSWEEAWLASPAVADLDGDGTAEIIVPRGGVVDVWHADGALVERLDDFPGRIWSSPVVADLRPDLEGLEFAVASRGEIHAFGADFAPLDGFPHVWRDEMRSLAAGDIDGDGDLELVAVTTGKIEEGDQTDILIAVEADGRVVEGFPPNTTGASGCTDACYVHSGYDQNVALGDVDGDGVADILAPQDNAYVSLHSGDGRAFDAASIFDERDKFPGIRFMLDYAEAQQGWAEDERSANQAHFTNTAPAIADVDGDGEGEIVMLGSVQNAAQSDRERGAVLFVVESDGTRPDDWVEPFHAEGYLDGLWDPGDNIVGLTNQVTVADIDPDLEGVEFIFAGFDGRIHAVDSRGELVWRTTYTEQKEVLTGGVLAVDLSRDGRPEIIFATYSTREDVSHLFILDAAGAELHRVALPGRGAMPVPTAADVNGDGALELVVSVKDSGEGNVGVLVYSVPGSGDDCLLWPTGRGNLLRNGDMTSAE